MTKFRYTGVFYVDTRVYTHIFNNYGKLFRDDLDMMDYVDLIHNTARERVSVDIYFGIVHNFYMSDQEFILIL